MLINNPFSIQIIGTQPISILHYSNTIFNINIMMIIIFITGVFIFIMVLCKSKIFLS